MALNIPNTRTAGESVSEGMRTGLDVMRAIWNKQQGERALDLAHQLDPLRSQLLQAQILESLAGAQDKSLLSNLISPSSASEKSQFYQSEPPLQAPPIPNIQDNPYFRNNDLNRQMFPFINMEYKTDENMPPMSGNNLPINSFEDIKEIFQPQTGKMTETIISRGNPDLYGIDKAAGIKGIPEVKTHYDNNGNLISRYPSGKVTIQNVSAPQSEIARDTEFLKEDAKLATEMTSELRNILPLAKTYKNLEKAFNDPEWKKMFDSFAAKYGGDQVRNATLATFRNLGTPAQQELIGKVDTLTNTIVAEASKAFKGPFRVLEQELVETMKPKKTDPLAVQMAKLKELQEATDYQKFVNTRVPTLIRREKISAQDAFEKAMAESGAKEFSDQIENKYTNPLVNQDYSKMSLEELRKIAQEGQ